MTSSILYLRYSTPEQADGQSELRQTKIAKRWCEEHESKLVRIFKDLGISGGKKKGDRKGLSDLMATLTHLCLLVDELARAGIPLVCTSQGIDTGSGNAAGKLQLDVLMAVCEFERGLIRERVNAGLDAARERGVRLGRPETLHERRNRLFTLQAHGGVWDAQKEDGELVMQLRFANGALLEKSPSRTEWQSHPRVYNIWAVWIEGLLAKKDDLGEPMTVP